MYTACLLLSIINWENAYLLLFLFFFQFLVVLLWFMLCIAFEDIARNNNNLDILIIYVTNTCTRVSTINMYKNNRHLCPTPLVIPCITCLHCRQILGQVNSLILELMFDQTALSEARVKTTSFEQTTETLKQRKVTESIIHLRLTTGQSSEYACIQGGKIYLTILSIHPETVPNKQL